jgi:hypothetical protein
VDLESCRKVFSRRANLDGQIISNVMFVKENTKFLHKHYRVLAKAETESSMHFLVDLKMMYLPPRPNEEDEIGVGQDDHLLVFV